MKSCLQSNILCGGPTAHQFNYGYRAKRGHDTSRRKAPDAKGANKKVGHVLQIPGIRKSADNDARLQPQGYTRSPRAVASHTEHGNRQDHNIADKSEESDRYAQSQDVDVRPGAVRHQFAASAGCAREIDITAVRNVFYSCNEGADEAEYQFGNLKAKRGGLVHNTVSKK